MKGVILAGGLGTRLHPLTNPLNKHLLSVYDKPMIMHVISTLVQGGVTDIMLTMNGFHPGLFLEMLEDGDKLGCNLTYRYLREADGPGRTLMMAENWIDKEDFVLILGDSLFFIPLVFNGKLAPHMFVMPLNDFDDHKKYGQVVIDGDMVKSIIWKPKEMFSNLIQATCFILPCDAFDRLKKLSETTNGEVSITALTSQYVDEGLMRCTVLPERSYIDCGSINALHLAAMRLAKL